MKHIKLLESFINEKYTPGDMMSKKFDHKGTSRYDNVSITF